MNQTVYFNERVYKLRRCREGWSYYSRMAGPKRFYLHRDVWEFYRGPIPMGHDIHHKFDDDVATTDPERLECLTRKEHAQHHLLGKTLKAEHRSAISLGFQANLKTLTAKELRKRQSTAKGKIWITDGQTDRLVRMPSPPKGWVRGGLILL